jgi:glycerol-3-phosphate dehydrogenase
MTPGAEHLSVEGTPVLWAELRWAARHEAVHHLDDLLLRRTRLGLLLPQGGAGLLERIEPICRAELGWSEGTWEAERERYAGIYQQSYSLPGSRGKIAESKVESKLSAGTRETKIERAVPA